MSPINIGKAWMSVCRVSKEFQLWQAEIQREQFYKANKGKKDWEYLCLTDEPTKDWHIPLITKNKGWWGIMESFRFSGPHVLTGLDTLIVRDIEPFLEFAETCDSNTLYGIRDFRYKHRWASGVTIWRGDWTQLFSSCGPDEMALFRGNQDFCEDYINRGAYEGRKLGYLQDTFDGILSYKFNMSWRTKMMDRGRICCFHGVPRPWDAMYYEGREWMHEFIDPSKVPHNFVAKKPRPRKLVDGQVDPQLHNTDQCGENRN